MYHRRHIKIYLILITSHKNNIPLKNLIIVRNINYIIPRLLIDFRMHLAPSGNSTQAESSGQSSLLTQSKKHSCSNTLQ